MLSLNNNFNHYKHLNKVDQVMDWEDFHFVDTFLVQPGQNVNEIKNLCRSVNQPGHVQIKAIRSER